MSRKCPECGFNVVFDQECEACFGGDENCVHCDGHGYIDGWAECASCGVVGHVEDFEGEE